MESDVAILSFPDAQRTIFDHFFRIFLVEFIKAALQFQNSDNFFTKIHFPDANLSKLGTLSALLIYVSRKAE